MPRLDTFLKLVVEQNASDLHFHAGNPPVIRHDGDLVPLPFRVLSELETKRFLTEIISSDERSRFENDQTLDFVYALDEIARFRASYFVHQKGWGGVFRIVPNRIPTLAELMMPPIVQKLTHQQNGLILVTGPTGSGKTTTLAAIIDALNSTTERHVITTEDPIEFVHESRRCLVTQRQIGRHAESFPTAVRSALRESPDVLIVGEMRDRETVETAISAAETGVLVIGTLHTNSASKAIDRIVDVVHEESREQIRVVLSTLLRGVIAQRLCKRANGDGRLAVLEILLNSYAVANLIRENKIYQIDSYLEGAGSEESDSQSLDYGLARHVMYGLITVEEAVKLANYPESLQRMVAEAGLEEVA